MRDWKDQPSTQDIVTQAVFKRYLYALSGIWGRRVDTLCYAYRRVQICGIGTQLIYVRHTKPDASGL